MKKIYLIVAALALTTAADAQTKGSIEFGFNTGYSMSTVSDDDDYAETNQTFNIGASADFYFSDRWSIKVKAIYDRKGWDKDFLTDINGNLIRTDINLDYITVPVMANWHFGSKRNWYLNFGPYVGFLMSAKETTFDTDIKDGFNTTDAGLAFGIGVKIPIGDKLKLFFEYDGQYGFSEVLKNNDFDRITGSRDAINVGLNFLL